MVLAAATYRANSELVAQVPQNMSMAYGVSYVLLLSSNCECLRTLQVTHFQVETTSIYSS